MRRKWKKARKWGPRPAKNLWWYRSSTQPPFDDTPTADTLAVIDLYLYWAARGRTLPKDFRTNLLGWLQDLNRPVKVKSYDGQPGKTRYWTLPNYAKAKKLEPPTFMKQIRRLAEIASELFPNRAPKARAPLTEQEIKAIQKKYWADTDVREIAKEFKITPARVGQLCADIKPFKRALREYDEAKRQDEAPAPEEPF